MCGTNHIFSDDSSVKKIPKPLSERHLEHQTTFSLVKMHVLCVDMCWCSKWGVFGCSTFRTSLSWFLRCSKCVCRRIWTPFDVLSVCRHIKFGWTRADMPRTMHCHALPICLDDSSASDLVRMQLRAWTIGVRAAPKHVAGTSAALGKKPDH